MRIILLFWLVCFATFSQAQEKPQSTTSINYTQRYSKRTWLLGLQAGYSNGWLIGTNLTAHAYGGYFIAHQVLIGLNATRSQEGVPSARDIAFSVGPMVRFQLTRTRISPFLMASAQFGRHSVRSFISSASGKVIGLGPSANMVSRLFGAGLTISLTPALQADLAINWQDKVDSINSDLHTYNGLYQAQLGINYMLGHLR